MVLIMKLSFLLTCRKDMGCCDLGVESVFVRCGIVDGGINTLDHQFDRPWSNFLFVVDQCKPNVIHWCMWCE